MPIVSFGDDLDDQLPIFERDGSISFTTREYEEIVCTECARVAGRLYRDLAFGVAGYDL